MSRKTKRTAAVLLNETAALPSKRKRCGRPRKKVAPEALLPYKSSEIPAAGSFNKIGFGNTGSKVKSGTAEEAKKSKPPRRTNPITCDRHYLPEEVEFMNALDEFKRASGHKFPTCSEILAVLKGLGYEKV
ncbi:MAG: hypothetical protein LBH00_05770 [Planctomycetaceae bacterium]|nr:hypothetical protein [Planctomycetaceae bacterium]